MRVGKLEQSEFAEVWEVSVDLLMMESGSDREVAERQLREEMLESIELNS